MSPSTFQVFWWLFAPFSLPPAQSTVVLEKTLGSPLDSKIKPFNLKGNQPGIFTGRTDAEAEAPILWPPNVKSRLIGKDPEAGKD